MSEYRLSFVCEESNRVDQTTIEMTEVQYEVECDYFTLQLLPGFEAIKLNIWNYSDEGPQVIKSSFACIESFEFENLQTGEKFGLNHFNDLFWKKSV